MSDLISRKALYIALFLKNGRICPDTDVDNFPITVNVPIAMLQFITQVA